MKRISAGIVLGVCAIMLVGGAAWTQSVRSDEVLVAQATQPAAAPAAPEIVIPDYLKPILKSRNPAQAGTQRTGLLDEVCVARNAALVLSDLMNMVAPESNSFAGNNSALSKHACGLGAIGVADNSSPNNPTFQWIRSLNPTNECRNRDFEKRALLAEKALAVARIYSAEACEIKHAVSPTQTSQYTFGEVPEIRRLLEELANNMREKLESIERRLTPAASQRNSATGPAPARN